MEDHYKLVLQRIDTYINSINTKGSFIVAFTTFICGSLIAKYADLKQLILESEHVELINCLIIILFIISILTVFIVGLAIFPYLKSGNSTTSKYHSHIFFNSIAEFESEKDFMKSCEAYSKTDAINDLQRQVYTLSKGLKSKFKKIGFAMILFLVNLLILALLTTLIIL
jgi:hypothetical protein